LEDSKKIFVEGTQSEKESRGTFLIETLIILLKTLHPLIPFVTEEIWSLLPNTDGKMLMVSKWPQND
jgi:valyl-tRNA synthetase